MVLARCTLKPVRAFRMGLTDGGNAIKERARERLKGDQEPKEERKKVTVRAQTLTGRYSPSHLRATRAALVDIHWPTTSVTTSKADGFSWVAHCAQTVSSSKSGASKALENFCMDLTERARQQGIDPVCTVVPCILPYRSFAAGCPAGLRL